jgi:type I restriction enzyme S subunit
MNRFPTHASGKKPQEGKRASDHTVTELGVLPGDWDVADIGSLQPFVTSGSRGWARFYHEFGSAFIRITNLTRDRIRLELADLKFVRLPDGAAVEASRTALQQDDVLISVTADIGIIGFVDLSVPFPAYINQHIALIRFDGDAVCSQFIAYSLTSERPQRLFRASMDVGAKAGMNLLTVRKIKLALPPTSEQRAIAGALSDVDGLIAVLEKLIAKKRAIKQAAMQQLLTAKTRLPGFTGKWDTKRLGDHVTYLNHGVNSRAELTTEGAVRYLHYGDVHAVAGPWFDPAHQPLSRLPSEKSARLDRLESGDLVLVDASEDLVGIGKSVELRNVSGVEIVAGLHTIAARFDKMILVDGFKGYLQYIPSFKSQLERLAAGTKVYASNRAHLSSVELPLPSTQEQSAIAVVLSDMDAEIEALERRREKTSQIKLGMMQQLLTGRIRLVKPQAPAPSAPVEAGAKPGKAHSWAFNEAVVIANLAKQFGKDEFPLGRKRYTKLSYLLHRHVERKTEGYLKKAAGPYNPRTKYGGPERIALESGYVREHKNGPYSGFVAGDKITQAEGYFEKWYGNDTKQWLEQFRFKKNDELELLATVDMAAEELRAAGQPVDVEGVKMVIRNHPDWQAKLDRPVFSDTNIASAMRESEKLFGQTGG